MVIVTIFVGVVQEMSARLGAVTGKGFSDLVRESFSLRATALILLTLFIANLGIIVSEFVGIAAGSRAIWCQPLHRRAARGRAGLAADHARLLRPGREDLAGANAGLPRLYRRRVSGAARLARSAVSDHPANPDAWNLAIFSCWSR